MPPLFTFKLSDPPCDPHYVSLIDAESLYNASDTQADELKHGTLRQVGWHAMNLPDEWFMSQHRCHTVRQLTRVMQCSIQYLYAQLKRTERHVKKVSAALRECDAERDTAFEEVVQLRETVARLRRYGAAKERARNHSREYMRAMRAARASHPTRSGSHSRSDESGPSASRYAAEEPRSAGYAKGDRSERIGVAGRNGALVCALCGNTYPSQGSLQSHMQKRHKATTQRASGERAPSRTAANRPADSADAPAIGQLRSEVMDMRRMIAQLVRTQQHARPSEGEVAGKTGHSAESVLVCPQRSASSRGLQPLPFSTMSDHPRDDAAGAMGDDDAPTQPSESNNNADHHTNNNDRLPSSAQTGAESAAVHVLHDAMSCMTSRLELLERMLRKLPDQASKPDFASMRREERGASPSPPSAAVSDAALTGPKKEADVAVSAASPLHPVGSMQQDEKEKGVAALTVPTAHDTNSHTTAPSPNRIVREGQMKKPERSPRHDRSATSRASTPSPSLSNSSTNTTTMMQTRPSLAQYPTVEKDMGEGTREDKDASTHSLASYVAPRRSELSMSMPGVMSYSGLHIPERGASPLSSDDGSDSASDTADVHRHNEPQHAAAAEDRSPRSVSPTGMPSNDGHADETQPGAVYTLAPPQVPFASKEAQVEKLDGQSGEDVARLVSSQPMSTQPLAAYRMHAPTSDADADHSSPSSSSSSSSSSTSMSKRHRRMSTEKAPVAATFQPRKYKSVATVVAANPTDIGAAVSSSSQPTTHNAHIAESVASTAAGVHVSVTPPRTTTPNMHENSPPHPVSSSDPVNINHHEEDNKEERHHSRRESTLPSHTTASASSRSSRPALHPPAPQPALPVVPHMIRPDRLAESDPHGYSEGYSSYSDNDDSEEEGRRRAGTTGRPETRPPTSRQSQHRDRHTSHDVHDGVTGRHDDAHAPVSQTANTTTSSALQGNSFEPRERVERAPAIHPQRTPHVMSHAAPTGEEHVLSTRTTTSNQVDSRRAMREAVVHSTMRQAPESRGSGRHSTAVVVGGVAQGAVTPAPSIPTTSTMAAKPQVLQSSGRGGMAGVRGNEVAPLRRLPVSTPSVSAASAPVVSQGQIDQLAPQKKKRKLGGMIKRFFSRGRSKEHKKNGP